MSTNHDNTEGLAHVTRSKFLKSKVYSGTVKFRFIAGTKVIEGTVVESKDVTLVVEINGRRVSIFKSMVVEDGLPGIEA